MSSDRVQAAQRNVYRRTPFKVDGVAEYQRYLWQLSWCDTPENVPQHAQSKCRGLVEEGFYSHLHPSTLWDDGTSMGLSYDQSWAMQKSRPPRPNAPSPAKTRLHPMPFGSVARRSASSAWGTGDGSLMASTPRALKYGSFQVKGDPLSVIHLKSRLPPLRTGPAAW